MIPVLGSFLVGSTAQSPTRYDGRASGLQGRLPLHAEYQFFGRWQDVKGLKTGWMLAQIEIPTMNAESVKLIVTRLLH